MRERLLWKKVQVLEVTRRTQCTSNCLITLIVHKIPSKFAPYGFKLRSKPYIFVRKPFLEWFLNPDQTRRKSSQVLVSKIWKKGNE